MHNYQVDSIVKDTDSFCFREVNFILIQELRIFSNEWNHNTKLRDSFDNAGDDGKLDSGEAKEKNSAPIQVVEEVSNILSRDELECLTVVQLKDKLRNSGLTVSGTKAKLINRLLGDETELK